MSRVAVRREEKWDAAAIRAVHLAAFATSAEADLVDALRADAAFLPHLSLVALAAPTSRAPVIGHVLFTRLQVGGAAALALAPLAVTPTSHGRGVGTALTRAGLSRAADSGELLVVVVGDPGYYSRFGFRPAAELGVRTPYGDGPQVMALALPNGSAGQPPQGEAVYAAPFAALE
jgi:putative acetyltransferase